MIFAFVLRFDFHSRSNFDILLHGVLADQLRIPVPFGIVSVVNGVQPRGDDVDFPVESTLHGVHVVQFTEDRVDFHLFLQGRGHAFEEADG